MCIFTLLSYAHTNVKSGRNSLKVSMLLLRAEARANITNTYSARHWKQTKKFTRKTNIKACVAQNESTVCHFIRQRYLLGILSGFVTVQSVQLCSAQLICMNDGRTGQQLVTDNDDDGMCVCFKCKLKLKTFKRAEHMMPDSYVIQRNIHALIIY